jgi:hypothetical protein
MLLALQAAIEDEQKPRQLSTTTRSLAPPPTPVLGPNHPSTAVAPVAVDGPGGVTQPAASAIRASAAARRSSAGAPARGGRVTRLVTRNEVQHGGSTPVVMPASTRLLLVEAI